MTTVVSYRDSLDVKRGRRSGGEPANTGAQSPSSLDDESPVPLLRPPPMPASSVDVFEFPIDLVYDLSSAGRRDRALDVLFANFDGLAEAGHYDQCDQVLADVDLSKVDTHVAIGFLSASYPFQKHLRERSALLARVRAWLPSRGKSRREVDELLRGML